MNRPIGIFDSGIGGLTVVKEIIKTLPYEDIIYFGDTARVPYGSKSRETIIRFSREIVEFLLERGVKVIVVACNTASSNALPELESLYNGTPFVGVIKPGVKRALSLARSVIGVIGTRATIESGIYSTALGDEFKIVQKPCSLFVPLVEEGLIETPFTMEIAKFYLNPLKKEHVDTLILGCTHYPMLKTVIHEVMGEGVDLVDSAVEVARFVGGLLDKGGTRNGRRIPDYSFYFSDMPGNLSEIVERFLGRSVELKNVYLG
ncbi:glutamate racemase [candidate division WOR-3 bacterium JGI_Cruoil_03_44_89]|uniref:Glutamate racemase n=1 Tax=candidate division WOR-3 bacterium JGI_Cruoil_03_44_89 TaxID=1973748 RepID=A0A235BVI1_UNCW3|nr:MAG: glutamate racemase [candidate division WOR-3 bacterium JGI_Cruoil_03_44_89]